MEQDLILGRYRPLAGLGEGGHGSVTLAYDTRMARRVAIKRLPLPRRSRTNATGLAEARTTALLAHPNVVTVHEWETDDDAAYLIMEHVEGVTLADLLDDAEGPLDIDAAAAVLGAVADALDHAHDNGVLHLDIKPENVLVDRDGRVKVADFGVSALEGLGGGASGSGGTLGFMPPEQLRGETLDASTDQWAFAALAYVTLTGAEPLAADTAEGALFKATVAEVPPPSEFEPTLPPLVDDAVLVALSPNADDRFADVATFAAELLPHLGDAAAGRATLAATVRELLEEEGRAPEREPLAARLARHAGAARRVSAALACLWLAWAGLAAYPLGDAAVWGGAGLVALAAALAPGLGLALALAAFSAGLFTAGILPGLAFAVPAAAYWLVLGRRGTGSAIAPVAAPLLGSVWAAPAVPLLVGLSGEPVDAAIAGVCAAAVAMVASAASGGRAPYLVLDLRLLADPWAAGVMRENLLGLVRGPGPALAALAWAAAAAIVAFASRRGSRVLAAIAALAGLGVMLASYRAWSLIGPPLRWPDPGVVRQLAGSSILVAVVFAAGIGPARRTDRGRAARRAEEGR